MSDSSEVDKAIVRTLMADAQLMALFPGGIFFDEAKPGTSKFVKVSLVEHLDVPEFAKVNDPTTGRAYETALYLVLVVAVYFYEAV